VGRRAVVLFAADVAAKRKILPCRESNLVSSPQTRLNYPGYLLHEKRSSIIE
jgi:hypothetical protein